MFGLQPPDRVLVVAAHPDDETLGMGGTIAALTDAGIGVDVLAVACTSGVMHGGVSDTEVRSREFDRACTVLQVARRRLAWIDTDRAHGLPSWPAEIVRLIESGEEVSLAASRPAALFLPAGGHHHDHRAVHAAALAAVRPGHRPDRPLPKLVAGYDGPEDRCWSTADAARPLVVDISDYTPTKTKALRCYASQLRDDPHPRSLAKVTALDLAAGAVIGVQAAERFALYRMVAS
ncbi:GlcNAc-PI de-N-acetylase [Actinomadura sp. KC06]|nr:GlcNAc-PI de-N-acetylase [Actinomadura sp. KC06]